MNICRCLRQIRQGDTGVKMNKYKLIKVIESLNNPKYWWLEFEFSQNRIVRMYLYIFGRRVI